MGLRIVIVRHAIAVPRGTPGIADAERPLTPRGARRFRRAARGLARLVRPDVLLSSPLRRARQTAEIAARAWGGIAVEEEPALATGSREGVLVALARRRAGETVALVGHEPHLSALLARLVGATDPAGLVFRKGGAALVEIPGPPEAGGRLLWFLPPRLLRAVGRPAAAGGRVSGRGRRSARR